MSPGLSKLKQKLSNNPPHIQQGEDTIDDGLVRVSTRLLIDLRRQAETIPLNAFKIIAPQSGAYLSPFKGRGMEFEESRIYQPGDDIRNIDWRVTARTGNTHTKIFQEERERTVLMWVDYRRPMFFATQGAFKSVVAARAAALLSWSTAQHGDRLGGLVFSEQHHHELKPQRGDKSVLHFIKQLSGHPAWEQDSTSQSDSSSPSGNDTAEQALSRLRRVAKPGSLIILFSDFRNLGPKAESHLLQLSRHNNVIMFFIHDPLEAFLPPAGLYQISNGSSTMMLNTGDKNIRATHQQHFLHHLEYLQSLCKKHRMFLLTCATNDDLEQSIKHGLGLRKR